MQCYCARVRQLARRLTRFYEAELRVAGMNPAQFELLATIKGRSGSSQSELAAAMDIDQTTLSRNLKLLIRQGWLMKTGSTDDRRRVEYRMTVAGRQALAGAMPCWGRAKARMEANLGQGAANVWVALERLAAAAS